MLGSHFAVKMETVWIFNAAYLCAHYHHRKQDPDCTEPLWALQSTVLMTGFGRRLRVVGMTVWKGILRLKLHFSW